MSEGIGLLDGPASLSEDINKSHQNQTPADGAITELFPELELSMDDKELISLKTKWTKAFDDAPVVERLKKDQKVNEKYWKGQQFGVDDERGQGPLDNVLFQAVETLLPIITRENPEPVVEAGNDQDSNKFAKDVEMMLSYQADRLKLKIKLQQLVRFWALYLQGVIKVGWDVIKDDITIKIIRPQKLILDPDAPIEGCEYQGEYIGEKRREKASELIRRFPKQKEYISELVNGNLGTVIQFEEWWTDKYMFWTLKNEVLGKMKNPHWDYGMTDTRYDEYGVPVQSTSQVNHFETPRKPYVFLSVFNLGQHPWDETSIIAQNIPLQDAVNKRQRQMDKNADNTNNGLVVSGEAFTKEQAADAAQALQEGGVVWSPTGDASSVISRTIAPALPNFVYETLTDYRNEIMNLSGVRGSTPAGISSEDTVRGKIIVKGQDADRASLIVEHIEQVADDVFNWFVQLMGVYYTEKHIGSVVGAEKARQYVELSRGSLLGRKLQVSVKAGSMIPKDTLTQSNQAVDLFTAGLLDPITAFEMMDFPNPRDTALKLVQYKMDPMSLFAAPQPQNIAPVMPQAEVPPVVPQGTLPQLPTQNLSNVPIQ